RRADLAPGLAPREAEAVGDALERLILLLADRRSEAEHAARRLGDVLASAHDRVERAERDRGAEAPPLGGEGGERRGPVGDVLVGGARREPALEEHLHAAGEP